MNFRIWRKPDPSPSPEALDARETVRELTERADEIYYERRYLLGKNHFAERIRLIYEGQ